MAVGDQLCSLLQHLAGSWIWRWICFGQILPNKLQSHLPKHFCRIYEGWVHSSSLSASK